jgi:hypothetical protein
MTLVIVPYKLTRTAHHSHDSQTDTQAPVN